MIMTICSRVPGIPTDAQKSVLSLADPSLSHADPR